MSTSDSKDSNSDDLSDNFTNLNDEFSIVDQEESVTQSKAHEIFKNMLGYLMVLRDVEVLKKQLGDLNNQLLTTQKELQNKTAALSEYDGIKQEFERKFSDKLSNDNITLQEENERLRLEKAVKDVEFTITLKYKRDLETKIALLEQKLQQETKFLDILSSLIY